jgi:hypothetical protein
MGLESVGFVQCRLLQIHPCYSRSNSIRSLPVPAERSGQTRLEDGGWVARGAARGARASESAR